MTNVEKLAKYVGEHPGCGVNDIAQYFDIDGAGAWGLILDGERAGVIGSSRPNGSKWAFHVV